MADEAETKNAREIMDDEAQTAGDELAADASLEERQARFDAAMDQVRQREEDERELARLEERRQYRQFVAGQVYPALIAKSIISPLPENLADRAVELANQLIAALDRAEALDGAADTAQ